MPLLRTRSVATAAVYDCPQCSARRRRNKHGLVVEVESPVVVEAITTCRREDGGVVVDKNVKSRRTSDSPTVYSNNAH